jgi:hypothetical protein
VRHAGRGSDCALRAEVIFTAGLPSIPGAASAKGLKGGLVLLRQELSDVCTDRDAWRSPMWQGVTSASACRGGGGWPAEGRERRGISPLDRMTVARAAEGHKEPYL